MVAHYATAAESAAPDPKQGFAIDHAIQESASVQLNTCSELVLQQMFIQLSAMAGIYLSDSSGRNSSRGPVIRSGAPTVRLGENPETNYVEDVVCATRGWKLIPTYRRVMSKP